MNILVTGSPRFDDYHTFIRGLGVAIDELVPRDSEGEAIKPEHGEIHIYTGGPVNINNFTASFANLSEGMLKQMGYRIKFHRFPYRVCVSNLSTWDIERVLVFGVRNLSSEPVAVSAGLSGIEVLSYG